jgi:hypothetical protein
MPGSSAKEIAELGKLFTGKHAQNMKSVRLKVGTDSLRKYNTVQLYN